MANTSRKHGRNKPACKVYQAASRLEKNKKRTAKRVERERVSKELKMLARIKAGKPVPAKWLVRLIDEVPL